MNYKFSMKMKATINEKIRTRGIEVDETHFIGMKPNEYKLIDKDRYIYGIDIAGKKYVKLITGWECFVEPKEKA